ncbi:MAG: glycosyltransferase family 2 protein [Mediterranea sp.]|jgi:glycosyltransferase involved in cell wall biosynthesis|nr:glycosyltransferase family 2 protein [Mediterranea sp.]
MKQQVLLSICIPTYNRSGVLSQTLERLLADPAFDEEVEIVISDNRSTDDTETQVRRIASAHPNVKYFRNAENVYDRNFYLALARGNGRYLKLMNDYACFKPGGLERMKAYIRRYDGKGVNLLFYSKLRWPHRLARELYLPDMNSFVRLVNNRAVWNVNFGVWKEHLAELDSSEELCARKVPQLEWSFQGVAARPTVVVNFRKYDQIDVPGKKIDYLFYVPHVVNYYRAFEPYVERGLISPRTIRYDKYRILSHYVGSRVIQYLYLAKEVSFDKAEAWRVLDGYFADIPYYKYLKLKGRFLRWLRRKR